MVPAAAVSTGSTRWRTALAQVGSIVVLAIGSACASHTPDTGRAADGPYIAASPEAFEGSVIGAGYCVDFVKAAAGVPRTAAWQEGVAVRGNPAYRAGHRHRHVRVGRQLHERVRQSRGDLPGPG